MHLRIPTNHNSLNTSSTRINAMVDIFPNFHIQKSIIMCVIATHLRFLRVINFQMAGAFLT